MDDLENELEDQPELECIDSCGLDGSDEESYIGSLAGNGGGC
jgi:hypothetical protein